jgi:hypothetical protein
LQGRSPRRRRVSGGKNKHGRLQQQCTDPFVTAGVVIDVCKDVPAWPGRHLLEDGEHRRRYFGLRTAEHRVIEFECTSQREYEMWTKGVARLLSLAGERKRLA